MSNVVVDKQKIDILANAIADKSGEPVTMTLDEMVEAVDGIQTGGGVPNLQAKTYTVSSAGTSTVTADSGYDGLSGVEVSVPSAVPWVGFANNGFVTESNVRKWHIRPLVEFSEGEQVGWMDTDMFGNYLTYNAVPSNTTVTPTESSQTIGGANYMMEGAVTVNAISSTYVGSGITRRSSSDLTASGATVTVPSGYYSAQASKAAASGTAGTPTATKGTVSNHSVTVTPSVTNTTGYITGSTKTGTAVTVSASELVSGSETKTANGTYDVTNLAELVVNVSGGGGGMTVATANTTLASANASIQFTGLSGEPTSFVVTSASNLATGASPYKTATVVFDGTDLHGQIVTNTSNANASYSTSFTKSYSNGTLTITGSGTNFQANQYKLIYTYGGSSANLGTAETQVGSGATSIAFTGLTDEPDYFSVIFKSNFSTSSGYQRVMSVAYDGTNTYGVAMDSGANALSAWSYTYSNGTLTVSSQGTNNGGYFHQPGYYQLTYGIGGTVEPVEIEVEPLSVTTNGTYTAPTGKAYSPVTVNVSGGSSKNAQVIQQNNTRVASTSYTKACGDITVSKTGTYDVYWTAYRTSTSGTWGTQLYIGNTAYGNAQTTFSSYYQTVHLSNVSLTANQEVSVYGRSRGSNYYLYVGQLTIIEA